MNDKHTSNTANITLSSRQKQVVRLIQQAKSNKEIACELCLTDGTIKEYVYHIFRKLGVTNRTELAIWACINKEVLGTPDSVAA